MGLFWIDFEVGDPQGQVYESVHALVDTGATYTSLPASTLTRLKVTPHDRLKFIHADGSEAEKDIGQTWVRVNGKSVITLVIFGEEGSPALLGAYTLEGVRLGVDPVNRRLVSVPGYLVSQWPAGDEGE